MDVRLSKLTWHTFDWHTFFSDLASLLSLPPSFPQTGVTGSVTPLDSFKTVMGSPEGRPLRRIAKDLDSPSLLLRLASPSSRTMRRLAVDAISTAISNQESVRNLCVRCRRGLLAIFDGRWPVAGCQVCDGCGAGLRWMSSARSK